MSWFKPRYEIRVRDSETGKLYDAMSSHYFLWFAERALNEYESMRLRLGFREWVCYLHDTKEVAK